MRMICFLTDLTISYCFGFKVYKGVGRMRRMAKGLELVWDVIWKEGLAAFF